VSALGWSHHAPRKASCCPAPTGAPLRPTDLFRGTGRKISAPDRSPGTPCYKCFWVICRGCPEMLLLSPASEEALAAVLRSAPSVQSPQRTGEQDRQGALQRGPGHGARGEGQGEERRWRGGAAWPR